MDDETTQSLRTSEFQAVSLDRIHFLLVLSGPDFGRRVPLRQGVLTIGRKAEANVQLSDPRVSGLHCRVIVHGENAMVEDLRSRNGTLVDRAPISGLTLLAVGSVLQVGSTLLAHECRSRAEVEHADRIEDELARARDYVLELLPGPVLTGAVRTCWRFIPSETLGGDAFGYQWLDPHRFAVYLLDVSGHGARAALHSVSVMNTLRRRALGGVDLARPSAVLSALNNAFPMEEFGGTYFTIWYGVYRPVDRRLTFASGGHPPALLTGAAPARPLATAGPGIGMFVDPVFPEEMVTVDPGSRLYLFSDGVFEVKTPEAGVWGLEGLQALLSLGAVSGPPELDRVERGVRARMAAPAFDDDFSLLIADLL